MINGRQTRLFAHARTHMRLVTAIALGAFACPGLARAQVPFEVLYSFSGGSDDGAQPRAALIQASDGTLYGTTASGGLNLCGRARGEPCGMVFQIAPVDGTVTIKHRFNSIDGYEPRAALLEAPDGSFYGTTIANEARGEVFRMRPDGTLTLERVFTDSTLFNGANPVAPVILAADGNFYGTTASGGSALRPSGTIFSLGPDGFLVRHRFSGPDGKTPSAALMQATDGNFYGTTANGGDFDLGTIFQMDPEGNFRVLYSFRGPDGANPYSALIQASDGNLYGTTYSGGDSNLGTIFQLTPDGTLTVVHSFSGPDGANPSVGLIQASDRNFYGTTAHGGDFDQGLVFEMTLDGVFGALYVFTGGEDGAQPFASLLEASDGNLYGTTFGGGESGMGVVFRLDTALPLTSAATREVVGR